MRRLLAVALLCGLCSGGCGPIPHGAVPPCPSGGPEDRDGDGHDGICSQGGRLHGDDCDDDDPLRFPGNLEVCDQAGHDEDCDPTTVGDLDRDGDGHVDVRCCNRGGNGSDGGICGADCHDLRADVNPDGSERCDGFDNDCDGKTDEGVTVMRYLDADFDGHGAQGTQPVAVCPDAPGYVESNDDCDDADPAVHPGMIELCDLRDNDCDGEMERPGEAREALWYLDADGDGFGVAGIGTLSCAPPPFPLICNLDVARAACFAGKGTPPTDPNMSAHHIAGELPHGLVAGDCDDVNNTSHPGAPEVCDIYDNDCNGRSDYRLGVNDFDNDDGDLHADSRCAGGTDCDDMDATIGPDREEVCDRFDNDCDGRIDEGVEITLWYPDDDGDGFGDDSRAPVEACRQMPGRAAMTGDCDDDDPTRHPGRREICNAIDDDCDGRIDELILTCGAISTISGRVDRRVDGEPVADAEIQVFDPYGKLLRSTRSDTAGSYSVMLAAGDVTLVVSPPAGADLVGLVRGASAPATDLRLVLETPAHLVELATALGTAWDPALGLVLIQFDGVSPAGGHGAVLAPMDGAAVGRVGSMLVDGGLLPAYTPPLAVVDGSAFAQVTFFDATPGLTTIAIADPGPPNHLGVPNCPIIDVADVGNPSPQPGAALEIRLWPVVENSVTMLRVDCSLSLGNCCTAHGDAGCDVAELQGCVCAQMASCCEPPAAGGWDRTCAEIVSSAACSSCPRVVPEGGACCTQSDLPGCGSTEIEACVCVDKPDCCAGGPWREDCAGAVWPLRCGLCPPAPPDSDVE